MTSVLKIEVSALIEYKWDVNDVHLFATDPGVTNANPLPNNFGVFTMIGDIVSVNGQAAFGTYVSRASAIKSSPTPAPGGAIADVTRLR
jgi:hypothetical protein